MAADSHMDPDSSPDLLPSSASMKGQGVRRVNRLPLVIVFGLICLTVSAITYTFYGRQEKAKQQVRVDTTQETVSEDAIPATSLPSENEFNGYIAAEPMPEDSDNLVGEIPAYEEPISDAPRNAVAIAVPALDERQMAMQEQRYQLVQRIQEAKLADLERALGEESTIKVGEGSAQPALASGLASSVPARLPGNSELDALKASMFPGSGTQDPNGQAAKRDFLSSPDVAQNYLPHTRVAPIAPHELKAGSVIPSVMISGLNSDLPGQVIAQVREDVYDSATGMHLLVPMGAKLVGTYDNAVTFGQSGALLAWSRVIYPDGSSVNLGMMPGADRAGYAGFRDKVNNHYGRIYGSAFLLSIFSAGTQLSQPAAPAGQGGSYDAQQILSAELGRQMGQLGIEQSRRNLDLAPTIEIRNGYKFNVMVTKDMVLAPYITNRAGQ